jgi:uncharacterized lipoprotein YajG
MSKIITILATVFLLYGCGSDPIPQNQQTPIYEIRQIKVDAVYSLSIVSIDSCEYIVFNAFRPAGLMTHKGNCKNPIHRCK